jgi:hypothetical protein
VQAANEPAPFHSQPPRQVTAGEMLIAAVVIVWFIASENVIAMVVCVPTLVEAFAGMVALTMGAVVSGGAAVVNPKLLVPVSALPAASLPAIVTVYAVALASGPVTDATVPAALNVMSLSVTGGAKVRVTSA